MKKIILLALILLGVFIYFTAEKKGKDGPTAGAIVDRSTEVISDSTEFFRSTWSAISTDNTNNTPEEQHVTLPLNKDELWDMYYQEEIPALCATLNLISPENAADMQHELLVKIEKLNALKIAYNRSINSNLHLDNKRKAARRNARDQLGAAITALYHRHNHRVHLGINRMIEDFAAKPDIY